jgi:hypothetical protein
MMLWSVFLYALLFGITIVIGLNFMESRDNTSQEEHIYTSKITRVDEIMDPSVFPISDSITEEIPEDLESDKPSPPQKSKKEVDTVNIECPGCDAQMKVPKLNELQEVTCKECGLSGEIEI